MRRKKTIYRIFAVVGAIYLNFELRHLWLLRKTHEAPRIVMSRTEAQRGRVPGAPPGVVSPTYKKPPQADPPVEVAKTSSTLTAPTTLVASAETSAKETPTPVISAAPPVVSPISIEHVAQSHIFVYFINGNKRVKVDLFHDLYPDRVRDFIVHIKKTSRNKNIDVKMQWLDSKKPQDGGPTSTEYIGYLYKTDATKLLMIFGELQQPRKNEILGGILSFGSLADRENFEEVSYRRSNVLFTYLENEDSNDQYEIFKQTLDLISNR